MSDLVPVRRALLSVSDKAGLLELDYEERTARRSARTAA